MEEIYQYLGTASDLEPLCVEEMMEEKEEITREECAELLFPECSRKRDFDELLPLIAPVGCTCYKSAFDGISAIIFDFHNKIQFVWVKI